MHEHGWAPHWVFGYGSLLADYGSLLAGYGSVANRTPSPSGFLFTLDGWRRVWNVATDNERRRIWELPDGSRPPVFVTFVNVEHAVGTAVNGLLFPVADDEALARMDRREFNYVRRELPASGAGLPAGVRAWLYVGSDSARARFERGCALGSACVSRWYHERVEGDYRQLGAEEWEMYLRSTLAPTVPDREIRRSGPKP